MVSPLVALAVAAAVHVGFQATVTLVVYPALAHTPPDLWREVHARHGRAITPLVALVYGGLVAATAWVVASDRSAPALLAAGAAAACIATTALVAAPTHARLVAPHQRLLRRLLAADRLRLTLATGCLVATTAALATG